MTDLVGIRGLHKTFGEGAAATVALDDIELSVGAGEIVGVVGESGSGKSTLANILLGLERPDAGSVEVAGRQVDDWLRHDPRGLRRVIQGVFQHPLLALDRRRSVGWLVAEPLRIHHIGDAAQRRARVLELLDAVSLSDEFVQRRPTELSGGQLQRVNIARALALDPQLLICDEAVSALDVSVQAQIINLLLDIQRQTGMAIVFISHDLTVVQHLADRILVLYLGRAMELGPADAVLRGSGHPYTSALLAASADIEDSSNKLTVVGGHGRVDRSGCVFALRCPERLDACTVQVPPRIAIGEQHTASCLARNSSEVEPT